MKKALALAVLFFLITLPHLSVAQQDAQFSQYMFNQIFYNPAYAGIEGVTRLTAIHRSQWAGYTADFDAGGGAPTTQMVSLNTSLLRLRSGIAFHVVNDQLGPLTNQEAQISYAYHLGFKESKLSLGVRLGLFSQSINRSIYRPNQPDDPLIVNGEDSQIQPDMAVGAYYRAEDYYAGISFNHLIKSEFDFGNSESRNALENHFIFTAGYHYTYGSVSKLVFTPSVLVKSDLNSYSFDFSVLAEYDDKMWGGLSFRQGEAAIVMLGYSLLKDKSLRLGYAFDYIIKDQDAKQPTSHEIFVTYRLSLAGPVNKKIQRTPRFRH